MKCASQDDFTMLFLCHIQRAVRPTILMRCIHNRSRCRRRPSGAVTLELILMLPVWLIFLLAIIEFGQVLSSQQQVELASRVGAEEASQTPDLPISHNGDIPANVLLAIDQQLAGSGMTRCHVRLEHNVVPEYPNDRPVPVTLVVGTCDREAPGEALPEMRRYVRVTVGIAMTELTPNLLRAFGFDIADRIVQHTTTFRYEL